LRQRPVVHDQDGDGDQRARDDDGYRLAHGQSAGLSVAKKIAKMIPAT
jgi:hypothetical protein